MPVVRSSLRAGRIARACAVAALVSLAGCRGGSTGAGDAPTTEQPPGPANAETAGEAPQVQFTSPTNGYTVESLGPMTEDASGKATAKWGPEAMAITVDKGAPAADPMATARSAMSAAGASATNVKVMSPPTALSLPGSKSSIKSVYSATQGTNAVTGKPNDVVVVTYWIPKDSSKLATLTYTVTQNQYDPQGADDVAETFRWR